MKLRSTNIIDINKLLENNFNFPIPKFEDCSMSASIEHDGKIIAVGLVKPVGEITMLIEPTISNLEKAKSIKLLFDEAIYQSSQKKLNQWYAFVDDDNWALSIRKHYGFTPVNRKCYTLEL